MFARRPPEGRMNRRGVGAVSGGATPLTILGSSLLQWVRADLDVVHVAGRVSAWGDQSGNGKNYSEAVAGNQPLLSASGGPNNRPYVSNDDAFRRLTSALALDPPATTPTLIYIVGRHASWIANRAIVTNETGSRRQIAAQGVTPAVIQGDGAGSVNSNTAGTVGSWFRWAALFNNATTDFLWIGATKQTGVSAGTTAANTARYLGHPTAGSSAIFDFADVLYAAPASAAIANQMVADLDSKYLLPWYGAGLT